MPEDSLVAATNRLLTLEYRPWRFGDSIAFEAMVAASLSSGDNQWREFARGFIRSWAASDRELVRLDCTAPGSAMVDIYKSTGDELVLDAARRLADYLMQRPRVGDAFATFDQAILQPPLGGEELSEEDQRLLADPPAAVYVDCLHFDAPLLTRLADATGEAKYADEGVRQALAYIALLQDPATGLFHHYRLRGEDGPRIPGWGRGQGWALLGLVDVVSALPPEHPHQAEIATSVRRLIAAMTQRQQDTGSWHTLVDDPTSENESTTAVFMEIGMRRAAKLGIVPAAEVEDVIQRAQASTHRSVENGVLRHASDGVSSSTVPSHYMHVPTDVVSPWSQGALVLALAER